MFVSHPLYGPGVVVGASAGCFVLVRFDRAPRLLGVVCPVLAVSLRVCAVAG